MIACGLAGDQRIGARELVSRAYFVLCLALGRLLRSARYSTATTVHREGAQQVRKRRLVYAPVLIWTGGLLLRVLDTGVRVLPQTDWEERECRTYRTLRRASIRIDAGGVLVLPRLPGRTLATLLEEAGLEEPIRKMAIDRAVVALAAFHRLGLTHGDAMAENVLIDLESGGASWFDFETIHDPGRPMAWRRADDVRALLVTCLSRTAPGKYAETVECILRVYADQDVTRCLARTFASVWRRSLTFHLGQAGLSFVDFREVGRLVRQA